MSLFPQLTSPVKLVLEERLQVLTSDQLTENLHLLLFWLSDLCEEEKLCPVDISGHHPYSMCLQRTQERVLSNQQRGKVPCSADKQKANITGVCQGEKDSVDPQYQLSVLLNSDVGPKWLIGLNLQFGTCGGRKLFAPCLYHEDLLILACLKSLCHICALVRSTSKYPYSVYISQNSGKTSTCSLSLAGPSVDLKDLKFPGDLISRDLCACGSHQPGGSTIRPVLCVGVLDFPSH